MTVRSTHLKLIGAAGAAALTVSAMASPALAAAGETASVGYNCLALGAVTVTPTADYTVAASPRSLVAGQLKKLVTTSTFSLNPTDTALAGSALTATAFSGTIATTPSNTGVGLKLGFPKTNLGNNGDGSTTASATGNALLRFSTAGTHTLKLRALGKVALQGYDAGGNKSGSAAFPDATAGNGPCKNTAGATNLKNGSAQNATVAVVKDKSKTAAGAKYSAKKNVATGTAKVKGAKFGLAGTGKVKFTLKKGTHTVKTLKGKLNKKGVASVKFKHLSKAGKYSITAKFGGDKGLKASSGKHTFRVK